MTLFWLLGLVVLLGMAGRLWSWEAWLNLWLQVARVPAARQLSAAQQPVWQRDWDVFRFLSDSDVLLRPVRASARAGPRPPGS